LGKGLKGVEVLHSARVRVNSTTIIFDLERSFLLLRLFRSQHDAYCVNRSMWGFAGHADAAE
jgi:hypothetical protein